jgi:phosphoribosyl-ATP pyrophosphohydrolase/phosphoribosyl-AMP cyclohydrolase
MPAHPSKQTEKRELMLQSLTSDYQLNFNDQGLIAAIAQSVEDGEVLMLAWMNQQAFDKTIETGQAHFWSRSRQKLWRKGETSGNLLQVTSISLDCDSDTVLLKVKADGPACHTGARSCFFTPVANSTEPQFAAQSETSQLQPASFSLDTLYDILIERQKHPRPGSYTQRLLLQGEDEILKKIGEEAVEIILAAKSQGDQRLIEEIADITYHSLVLLVSRGLSPGDILAELARRHGPDPGPG